MRKWILILALAAAVPVGCKAAPAEAAGFVDDDRMKEREDLPFQRAWEKDGADWSRYSKVYVAPVDTSHLLEMTWWHKVESGEELEKDLPELAEFTRTSLQEAFEAKEGNRYTLVKQEPAPGAKDTLVLEFALVHVIPSRSIIEALSWAIPFGGGMLVSQTTKSSAAMEGRFREAGTGEALLEFRDREGEKASPLDLKGLTWYAHAKGIIKDWSAQLVKVANRKPGEVVEDTKTYTLKPW